MANKTDSKSLPDKQLSASAGKMVTSNTPVFPKSVSKQSTASKSLSTDGDTKLQTLFDFSNAPSLLKALQAKLSAKDSPEKLSPDEEALLTRIYFPKLGMSIQSGVKRFDFSFTGGTATYLATASAYIPVQLAEGSDYFNRLGRAVRLLKTTVRITGEWDATVTFTGANSYENPVLRFLMCLDKMPILTDQWAEDNNPTVSYVAPISTLGGGTAGNTIAVKHPLTVPARYHHMHDHKLHPTNMTASAIVANGGGTLAGGSGTLIPNTTTTSAMTCSYNFETEIDWKGARHTYYSSGSTTYLENAVYYWIAQDGAPAGGAPVSLATYGIMITTYFDDVQV